MSFCKQALHKDSIVTPLQCRYRPLQNCWFYSGRDCVNFGIFGTKKTICDREVAVLWMCNLKELHKGWRASYFLSLLSFEILYEQK